MFKNYLKLSLLLGLLAMLLFSCEREDLNINNISNLEALSWGEDGTYYSVVGDESIQEEASIAAGKSRVACFKPVFPLTFLLADGSTQEVQDQDELKELTQAFRESGQDRNNHPTIVFPHEVEFEDGTIETVESQDEVKELLKECRRSNRGDRNPRDADRKPCFKWIFPVTLEYSDGTTEIANSSDELKTLLKEWKENNDRTGERPHVLLPADVELKNGDIVTITTPEELARAAKSCHRHRNNDRDPRNEDRSPCFTWIFPITLEYPDGTTDVASSSDELKTLMMEWKENNERSREKPHVQLPADVELKNGNTITISSKEELARAAKSCHQGRGGDRDPRRGGR